MPLRIEPQTCFGVDLDIGPGSSWKPEDVRPDQQVALLLLIDESRGAVDNTCHHQSGGLCHRFFDVMSQVDAPPKCPLAILNVCHDADSTLGWNQLLALHFRDIEITLIHYLTQETGNKVNFASLSEEDAALSKMIDANFDRNSIVDIMIKLRKLCDENPHVPFEIKPDQNAGQLAWVINKRDPVRQK